MCAQAGQASAQLVVPVTIPLFGFSTPNITLYGQPVTFVATLTVPVTNPLPIGNVQFLQNSQLLATAPIATAGTASGNNVVSALLCLPGEFSISPWLAVLAAQRP